MPAVFLSLGSNLGDKSNHLRTAIEHIEKQIGSVMSRSAFYITEPWGFESDNAFMNAVIEVETDLSPIELLYTTQAIEKTMGRTFKSVRGKYADRIIDIDILLYGDRIINTRDLALPHPHLHERLFVLEPLAEIAPETLHPVLHKTFSQLLFSLQENS